MKLREGDIELEFKNAINVFKFDETNKNSDYYHGLTHCMKAVDIIVELPNEWIFVEVKDPSNPHATQERKLNYLKEIDNGKLVPELVTKFRDTFLYHWAEKKAQKPIKYICLITLENALVLKLMNDLKRQLPEGKPNPRWEQSMAQSSVIANIETWNASFSQWPVNRVSS